MLKSVAKQFIGWLDRVVDADERVVCAVCDQRFCCFEEGNVHVRMAHPQFIVGAWQPAAAPSYASSAHSGGFRFA
jgi:hypothetical protein